MTVKRTVSLRASSKEDMLTTLNREVVPTLAELRLDHNILSKVTAIFGTYSVGYEETYIECDGTFEVLLPNATSIAGKRYDIKNVGTGVITIFTSNSQTIDQHASGALTLPAQWDSLTVVSNGENWRIL